MAHLNINSPFGTLSLFEDAGALIALEWGQAPKSSTSPVLVEAKKQLDAYFDGRLKIFDLPLKPAGTLFQQAVWKRMIEIPYGLTVTYGELAKDIGSAPRAVGNACAKNPIPIIIPCHRVVGANRQMVGYSGGGGMGTKQALLGLEGWTP